ncbi:SMI1/KNR4 family protein [Stenotrophomonas sp.]|uniref:SMI1/KNR4 family protein n=1 Tax=Stenotrophomonas sp. TaxID=69392 RepID=UPI0031F30B71
MAARSSLDLIRVEGFRLPGSYCEFAATFGYGRFGGLAIIYSGVPEHQDSILVQGARAKGFINDAVADDYFEFEPDGDNEIAARLYPFAASENGECFVWDLNEKRADEYPIYCVGARMAGLRYAAKSLDQLLEKLCSGSIKDVMGPGYAPLLPTFEGL